MYKSIDEVGFPHHQDPHLLLSEEAFEERREDVSHLDCGLDHTVEETLKVGGSNRLVCDREMISWLSRGTEHLLGYLLSTHL